MSNSVHRWLDELGLGQYADAFAENDIDLRALPHLSEGDLKELGVSLGHRKVIFAGISALQADPAPTRTTSDAPYVPLRLAPAESAGREAERRLLSIMFCDLVGSTELSQKLDPEEMRDVMRRYQDAVSGSVTRFGGHVAKYLGDGVLACFGWPLAYEDQAERAVRAGLEAISAVALIKTDVAAALRARVGIATGHVVVGDLVGSGGREEGAISGDTPNLAARLQTVAEPGQVVVAEATRRLIGGGFALEDRGERQLKGFDRPVRTFRVAGERQVESRFEAAHSGTLTAFVGRTHELGMLADRWQATCSGQGQVVLVSGEAGIGKSRLVEALAEKVAPQQHQLIRIQCSPYHANSAFHPVIERIARVAGLATDDSPQLQLARIERMIEANGEDVASKAPIYAHLLSLHTEGRYPPLDLTPIELKERTIAALVERLVLIAKRTPVLFVAEDAHWIDPSTLELLERFVDVIANLRIMIVVTHRPEWQSERLAGFGQATALTVGRLGRLQITELMGEILCATPDTALVDDISSRTDGVPLFVEELTRAVAEGGGAEAAASSMVPATLQGSLMARLDRLSRSAKTAALVGSVIGREFDAPLLAQVSRMTPESVEEALAELRRARIVIGSVVSRGRYVFRHALIQDTAYQSVLSRTRKRHHRRIAEALVAAHGDIEEREPEIIARHFSEAGRPERALPYWHRAATRALARSANFEAVSHAEMALAHAGRLEDAAERARETLASQLVLGRALESSGRLQDAIRTFRAAVNDARSQGDRAAFSKAALGFDNSLFLSAEPVGEAIGLLEEALANTAEEEGGLRCELLSRLGRASLLAGDGPSAAVHNRRASALARELGDPLALFNLLVNDFLTPADARTAGASGDWVAKLDEMNRFAEQLNDDARGRGHSFDIFISAEMGDRDRMDRALHRLTELGETGQHLHQQWIARHGNAMQAILDGDFDAAERHAEAGLKLGSHTLGQTVEGVYGIQMFTIRREQKRLGEVAPVLKRLIVENPNAASWKPGFAVVACDLGFHAPAARILDELAEGGFSFPPDAMRSTTLAYLAETCVALGDEHRAEMLYELLLPYAEMTVTAGVTTVCYGAAARYLGLLSGVLGDWEAAERHFEVALRLNGRMRAMPWLAHSKHDFATVLKRRDRQADTSRIRQLLNEAFEDACRFGMLSLRDRLRLAKQ